jgi:predicted branched-subunit amino acid permease
MASGPPRGNSTAAELRSSRRRLVVDSLGIIASVAGFGVVYGLSAREAGLSLVEAMAMSTIVFAGGAQFAAVGYIASGVAWPGIVLLTAFLNARHLLYAAGLAPYLADRSRAVRATLAFFLTDETFALSIAHFNRIGRADLGGLAFAAFAATFVPWNAATAAGVLLGGSIPDPKRIGLDVVFPAAMGGLAVGLISGRRDVVAAVVAVAIAATVSLAWDPAAGLIAGGVLGPLAGIAVPTEAGSSVSRRA